MMMKKIGLWVSAVLLIALQSCSVNTETTYYKDSASSMESNILIDKGMLSMMNMMGGDQSKPTSIGKAYTIFKKITL